jgi:nucleoside-diphosphate-sugar epimerase
MPVRTFVTGGSGFLGRTLIATLRDRGATVRALTRSPAAQDAVRRLGAEPVPGDLDDVDALRCGAAGCDVVFHAAACLAEWGPDALFERVNVTGTANVLTAARAAGVPRVVHVSTEAVLAGRAPIVRADETAPAPDRPYGPYARTKLAAERRVVAASVPGFTTVVVRPRFIWGAGDTSLLPKIVAAAEARRFRWIDGGRYLTSTTHVQNACEALLLAAERGHPGAIYFATDGPPIEYRQFVTALLATRGVTPTSRSVPHGLARTIAMVSEGVWRTLRLPGTPPATRLAVAMLGREVTLDDSRARRELGYTGRVSVEAGLRAMEAGAPAGGAR